MYLYKLRVTTSKGEDDASPILLLSNRRYYEKELRQLFLSCIPEAIKYLESTASPHPLRSRKSPPLYSYDMLETTAIMMCKKYDMVRLLPEVDLAFSNGMHPSSTPKSDAMHLRDLVVHMNRIMLRKK